MSAIATPRARRWLFVGVGALALGGIGWTLVPARTEASVLSLLSGAGEREVTRYVWLPSTSRWSDLWTGRPVTFAALDSHNESEVYVGRVHLLPTGHPLFAGPVTAVSRTAASNDSEPIAHGARFAFLSRHGEVVSVSVGSLDRPDELLRFDAPPGKLDLDLEFRDSVLAAGEGDAALVELDLEAKTLSNGAPVARLVPMSWAKAQVLTSPGQALEAAPNVLLSIAPGRAPAVTESRAEGAVEWSFDPQQLDLEVIPGRDLWTPTGLVGGGRSAEPSPRTPVLVFEWPGNVQTGYWSGRAAGPLYDGEPFFASGPDGFRFGVYGAEKSGFVAAREGVLFPEGVGTNRVIVGAPSGGGPGAYALCLDDAGHLRLRTSEGAKKVDVPSGCRSAIGGQGAVTLVSSPGSEGGSLREGPSGPSQLRVYARAWSPPSPPKGPWAGAGEWAPFDGPMPAPTSIPSVHTLGATALGTSVKVLRFDDRRFTFQLVAGTEEKSHRLGGVFETSIASDKRGAALLGVSLGIGKRKGPRGLKIRDSLGHRFSRREGILSSGDAVRVSRGEAYDPEREATDATELPLTLDDRQVTGAARDRGPNALRSDLCVLGEAILFAESTFDSHEPNAEVLSKLGCEFAVALDRGAERPSQIVLGEQPASAPETRLIGYGLPIASSTTSDL